MKPYDYGRTMEISRKELYTQVICPKCNAPDEVIDLQAIICASCGHCFTLDKYTPEAHTTNPAIVPQKSTKEVKTMSEYQIRSNVPIIPRKNVGAARTPKYPFADLKDGQGFFVEGKNSKSFGSAVSNAMKRTGHRYVVRSTDNAGAVFEDPSLNGKAGVIVVRKDS